jgi:hypothetical protein
MPREAVMGFMPAIDRLVMTAALMLIAAVVVGAV